MFSLWKVLGYAHCRASFRLKCTTEAHLVCMNYGAFCGWCGHMSAKGGYVSVHQQQRDRLLGPDNRGRSILYLVPRYIRYTLDYSTSLLFRAIHSKWPRRDEMRGLCERLGRDDGHRRQFIPILGRRCDDFLHVALANSSCLLLCP